MRVHEQQDSSPHLGGREIIAFICPLIQDASTKLSCHYCGPTMLDPFVFLDREALNKPPGYAWILVKPTYPLLYASPITT